MNEHDFQHVVNNALARKLPALCGSNDDKTALQVLAAVVGNDLAARVLGALVLLSEPLGDARWVSAPKLWLRHFDSEQREAACKYLQEKDLVSFPSDRGLVLRYSIDFEQIETEIELYDRFVYQGGVVIE